jgi:predicted AlkP superfamily phosphohydrolase/phosphomutase
MSLADLLPGMLGAVMADGPLRRESAGALRTPVWSLRSRIPAGWRARIARMLPDAVIADLTTRLYARADWPSTRAFAVPGENKGYVRLNLRGREREGVVDPAQADELLASIAEGLLTFHDADGIPAIERMDRMSELSAGRPYHERLPDLVITWADRQASRMRAVSSPRYGPVERSGVGSGRSGHHRDDAWAVVVASGARPVDPGRQIRITDIGATACALAGADPSGLSGSPLLGAA